MCGIAYIRRVDKKPAFRAIWKRYKKQKERGQEGFGYVAIGSKCTLVRSETEKDIEKALSQETASEILFHHRFPTSTPNLKEMAHPIEIENKILKYKYLVVHNGIVTNDDELKAQYEKMGFKYSTQMEQRYITPTTEYTMQLWNDSETLGIAVALAIEGKKKKIEATGSCAFIVVQTTKSNKPVALYYGRNDGNPLHSINHEKVLLSISSKGGGAELTPHKLYRYDYFTRKTTEQKMTIGNKETFFSRTSYDWSKKEYNEPKIGFSPLELEEEDFESDTIFSLVDDIEDLESDLNTARVKSDYDSELKIESELYHVREELAILRHAKK